MKPVGEGAKRVRTRLGVVFVMAILDGVSGSTRSFMNAECLILLLN
jgi:hypothetical protein